MQRFIAVAVVALVLSGSTVYAQCGCNLAPVSASVAPSYTADYAPAAVGYAPSSYVSYYTPPAAPVSYVSYYAPTAPVSYVSYYAPPAVAAVPYVSNYPPAVPYSTYYTPYTAYAPVVAPYSAYYGVAGVSVYGTPRVYVPGEPVRNVLRAVTP